jgi:hypothetical protein
MRSILQLHFDYLDVEITDLPSISKVAKNMNLYGTKESFSALYECANEFDARTTLSTFKQVSDWQTNVLIFTTNYDKLSS